MSDLGKAYVQIVPAAEGISGSISSILDKESSSAGKSAGLNIAGGIGTALKGATSLVAAGAAAVTGAITKGSADVAAYGDNIDKMSQKMGLSAQSYQEWDAVMQHSGTSMEAMKSSMKTLANAAQTNSKAFEELGISQEQLATMSQEQLFEATIAALQNVENETERTYLAGKTLGRGATELGALLNTSAEDTQAMRDRVHELGGVMGDDAVKAAALFQDNMQDMQTAISGLGRGMISELLPSMNEIIAGFTSLITGEEGATEALTQGFEGLFDSLTDIVGNIIDKVTELMPAILDGITTLLPKIIDMAAELLISFAEALVGALPQLITTVIPALLEAAVKLVVAFGKALVEAAPKLIEAGMELFKTLRESFDLSEFMETGSNMLQSIMDGITEKLPGLLEEGVEIVTNIVTGILESLPQLIETAGNLITQFASFFLENMPSILEAGTELLLNIVTGIVNSLPKLIEAAVKVITQMIKTLTENFPKILETGIKLLGQIAAGLLKAIPDLLKALPEIFSAIIKAFADVDWLSVGVDIIKGIAKGIASAVGAIVEAAVEAAKAAFNAAKQWLGIASPSKKGIWMGQMLDDGFALGIEKNSSNVEDAITDLSENATAKLTASTSSNLVVSGRGTSDAKMDLLLEMLANYLPEIAENKGISTETLYSNFNRQLGAALT